MQVNFGTKWYQVVPWFMAEGENRVGRWKLPEPLANELHDFAEAHRGAPEQRIIADALRAFIDDRLGAESELKKRFEKARLDRIKEKNMALRVVDPNSC